MLYNPINGAYVAPHWKTHPRGNIKTAMTEKYLHRVPFNG
jgi:hypothetical protein